VTHLRTYLVERYLPRLDERAAAHLARRIAAATAALRREGIEVEWVGSLVLVTDETCLCTFRARADADVVRANQQAAAPFDRITEAILLGACESDRYSRASRCRSV
jgi:uncharacterized protein DUF4242